jgi:hypothetical protein
MKWTRRVRRGDAEAFRRVAPKADVRFLDTGRFALETHVGETAAAIREFPARAVAAST